MGVLREIEGAEESITKCQKKIDKIEKSMKLKLPADQLQTLTVELGELKELLRKQETKLSRLRRENRRTSTTALLILLLLVCLFYFTTMLIMQWGLPSFTST